MLGGSHSYGLNTESSDIDHRGIFLNETCHEIIGLGRFDHHPGDENEVDGCYWELRRFLHLLQKGNTQGLELLFNDDWIVDESVFQKVISNREHLIDTRQTFKCLTGYIFSERRLATGERTGQLGSKRKAALDQYGYSPKNVVQLMRLCWAGAWFFNHGVFPVNVENFDNLMWSRLMEIKTKPGRFSVDQLMQAVDALQESMNEAFDSLHEDRCYHFSQTVANQIIVDAYLPILQQSNAPVAQLNRVSVS